MSFPRNQGAPSTNTLCNDTSPPQMRFCKVCMLTTIIGCDCREAPFSLSRHALVAISNACGASKSWNAWSCTVSTSSPQHCQPICAGHNHGRSRKIASPPCLRCLHEGLQTTPPPRCASTNSHRGKDVCMRHRRLQIFSYTG